MRVERDAFGNPVPSPAKEARKTRKRIRRRLRRDHHAQTRADTRRRAHTDAGQLTLDAQGDRS